MRFWLRLAPIGFVPLAAFLLPVLPGEESPSQQTTGPTTAEEVIATAEFLGLHCTAQPPGRGLTIATIYISDHPLQSGTTDFWMHDRDPQIWRGIVRVSVLDRSGYRANYDPSHADHFAMWGEMFLYGDPELIARLRNSH
jgi:hypothetical protein